MDNNNNEEESLSIGDLRGVVASATLGARDLRPMKVKDIPLNISVGDKWYKVKSNLFEGDLPSNEDTSLLFNKVFKLHKLIIYLSMPGAFIDIEYYIKENDLWELLEEAN